MARLPLDAQAAEPRQTAFQCEVLILFGAHLRSPRVEVNRNLGEVDVHRAPEGLSPAQDQVRFHPGLRDQQRLEVDSAGKVLTHHVAGGRGEADLSERGRGRNPGAAHRGFEPGGEVDCARGRPAVPFPSTQCPRKSCQVVRGQIRPIQAAAYVPSVEGKLTRQAAQGVGLEVNGSYAKGIAGRLGSPSDFQRPQGQRAVLVNTLPASAESFHPRVALPGFHPSKGLAALRVPPKRHLNPALGQENCKSRGRSSRASTRAVPLDERRKAKGSLPLRSMPFRLPGNMGARTVFTRSTPGISPSRLPDISSREEPPSCPRARSRPAMSSSSTSRRGSLPASVALADACRRIGPRFFVACGPRLTRPSGRVRVSFSAWKRFGVTRSRVWPNISPMSSGSIRRADANSRSTSIAGPGVTFPRAESVP